MRLVLIFALMAAVYAEPVDIIRRYHEEQGIPRAKEIKAAEELAAKYPTLEQRIVEGDFAAENEHPYLAGLLIDLARKDHGSVCGASLVSANRLVTAAHCWNDGEQQAILFTVVLGTLTLYSGGTRITTKQVVVHDSYNPDFVYKYDIAMVYLPTYVTFSDSIAPVALPEGDELWMSFEGRTAVAAGYGFTSDQYTSIPSDAAVKHVLLRILYTLDCQADYGNIFHDWNICTDGVGGRGICNGDSGGPLVTYSNGRRVLVGVSSFKSPKGCQRGNPSGFTRVTSYIDFIRQNM